MIRLLTAGERAGIRSRWVGLVGVLLWACSSAPPRESNPTPAPPEPPPGTLPEPSAPAVPRPIGAALRVVPVAGVVSLAVGEEHACVARADGRVLCWGNGATYRLGNGIAESSKAPLLVPPVDHVVRVAAGGAMSCAIRQDATVLCWGGYRQLAGDPDGMEWPMVRLPQVVAQPVGWTRQVSAGWTQASLLDGAGGVSILDAYVGPVPLTAFAPVTAIASLSDGFCALTKGGGVQCVTSGEFGASGNGGGKGGYGEEPGTVLAPLSWSESLRPLLFDADGNPQWAPCSTWEDPSAAADPSGPTDPAATVATVPAFCKDALVGASAIDAQGNLACAVLGDGGLACWGCARCFDDNKPPLGFEAGMSPVPFRIAGVTGVAAVAVGGAHLCTLHKDGAVRCWGDDNQGQLGPRGHGSTATPTVIAGLGEVVGIDAGEATTCALRKDGTVACWGHVLGTVLPDRYAEPDADNNSTPPLVTDRVMPEALVVAAPDATLVCRVSDVFDATGDLVEVQYRYDKQGQLAVERHSGWTWLDR